MTIKRHSQSSNSQFDAFILTQYASAIDPPIALIVANIIVKEPILGELIEII